MGIRFLDLTRTGAPDGFGRFQPSWTMSGPAPDGPVEGRQRPMPRFPRNRVPRPWLRAGPPES